MRRLFFPPILWRIILTTSRWTTPRVSTHLKLLYSTAPTQKRDYPRLSSSRNQVLKPPIVESQLLCRWFVSSKLNSNRSRHSGCSLRKLSSLNQLTMVKWQETRTILPNPLTLRYLVAREPQALWCSNSNSRIKNTSRIKPNPRALRRRNFQISQTREMKTRS